MSTGYEQIDIINKILQEVQGEATDYVDSATQSPGRAEEYISEMRTVLMSHAMGRIREETSVPFSSMEIYNLQQDVLEIIDGATRMIRLNNMSKRKQIVECKSVADVVYWLQAAGIAFAVGYQINDYFRLTQRLGDAIDAVREAMMFMRYGSTLADLERSISTLEQAGITVPAEIQSIANDPREGNDSEIPATNIAMARAWLDSALQHLQEAQAQAQNGDSTEMRSEPHDENEEKGMIGDTIRAVENALSRLWNASTISDLRDLVRQIEDAGGEVPAEIQDIIDNPTDGPISSTGTYNLSYARGALEVYLAQLQEREQRSDPRPVSVKSAGAHSLYR